jgi:hypothetical protein
VPRLTHVRVRLPLQEDLLQLVFRKIREVHALHPHVEAGIGRDELLDAQAALNGKEKLLDQ